MQPFISAILAATFFLSLSASVHAAEWQRISASDSKLRFNAIVDAQVYYISKWNDAQTAHYEYGQWVSRDADRKSGIPRAAMMLHELAPIQFFGTEDESNFGKILGDSLKGVFRFLRNEPITFQEQGMLGETVYHTFRLPDAECIGFYRFFGEIKSDNQAEPIAGTKLYYGYYCDAAGWVERDGVGPILEAITVKYEAVAASPDTLDPKITYLDDSCSGQSSMRIELSGPAMERWGEATEFEPAPPDKTEIVLYAEQFSDVTPLRFIGVDQNSTIDTLIYITGSYKAGFAYIKSQPDASPLYTFIGYDLSNLAAWDLFRGKCITVLDHGNAESPIGNVNYDRFLFSEAVCFHFRNVWENALDRRTRMLYGFVCNDDPAGLPHAKIADLLVRLGVRGKAPDPALDPRKGVVSVDPAAGDSNSGPSSDEEPNKSSFSRD